MKTNRALLPLLILLAAFIDPASAQNWQLMDGAARDVGVGANGTVWVIGTSTVPGGYEIYRRNATGWTKIPGGAERIAVDPQGNAWVVNNTQTIFRYDGSQWVTVSGQARDVGVAANGTVWVIGNNAEAGGYGIYKSTDQGANWTKVPGSALRISVDPTGNAWVVNSYNSIYRYDGSQWLVQPGAAKDIGIGSDGATWVIGTDGGIYKWDGSNWAKKTGGAGQIAAGPNGNVWVVNDGNQIYQAQEATAVATAPASSTIPSGSIVLNSGTITTVGPTGSAVQVTPGGTPVSGTAGSTSLTGGTLVTNPTGTGVVTGAASSTPLVVSGVGGTFIPTSEPNGRLLCPIIVAGPKLAQGCIGLFGNTSLDSKTSGPATLRGPARGDTCPSGFRDDGDYCAKPEAYGRGWGYAWQFGDTAFDSGGQWSRCRAANSQGCEQPGGGITLVYPKCRADFHAFGTNICTPDCPAGWDDIGVSCKKPNTVGNCATYGRVAGLTYAFNDPRNGGECWSCPTLMHRTFSPVTSTDANLPACTTGNEDGIMWASAQYPEPGVVAFVENQDILRFAFNDAAYVDNFLAQRAGATGMSKQQLWDQMINAPNDSPEFKALLFSAILTVAKRDTNLTTNAGKAVTYFQSYVQRRRIYVARDARAMYDAYKGFNSYKINKGVKQVMLAGGPLAFASAATGAVITSPGANLGSTVGVPPDDYVNKAYAAAVPDARGEAYMGALNDLAGLTWQANTTGTPIFDPSQAIQLGLNVSNTALAVHDLLDALRVVQGMQALNSVARMGVDLGMSVGGNVLDAVGAVLSVYAQQEAEIQYGKLVDEASKPVNIGQILASGSEKDKQSLIMWWALGTSGHRAGTDFGTAPVTNAEICAAYVEKCGWIRTILTPLRPAATAAATTAPTTFSWQLVSGGARDIGVGANGTAWVIGTNPVGGGYSIWRRNGNGWTQIPGGAERIAVDPQGNAWVVNSTNNIYRYDGTNFVVTTGGARDIGVGGDGTVWVIGTNAVGGGYGIYRSTNQGATWTNVPGGAVRISVDPQGNAWIVNSANTIYRYDGSSFVQLPGAAKDVGVGADGRAWVIGTDGGIYLWNGSNWTKKPGGADQIAAGSNGVVWAVNASNQIWQAQEPSTSAQAPAPTFTPPPPEQQRMQPRI